MEYQKAIVSFIDILGFKEMIKNEKSSEIAKKLKAINSSVTFWDDEKLSFDIEIIGSNDIIKNNKEFKNEKFLEQVISEVKERLNINWGDKKINVNVKNICDFEYFLTNNTCKYITQKFKPSKKSIAFLWQETSISTMDMGVEICSKTLEEIRSKLLSMKNTVLIIIEEAKTENNDLKTFQFSDSVIRIKLTESERNLYCPSGYFFHELNELAYAQGQLIIDGILIRGGVSYGNIYFDDNNLFGPALVKAYELESSYSVYPRIIVDPLAINEFTKNRLLGSDLNGPEEKDYVKKCLKQSDDGLYFINYLEYFGRELLASEPDSFLPFINKHTELLNNMLQGTNGKESLNRINSKLLWLIQYHNESIKSPNKEEYFIETDKPLFQRL